MRTRLGAATSLYSTSAKTVDLFSEDCRDFVVNARAAEGGLIPGMSFTLQSTFPTLPANVTEAYYSQGNGALYVLTSSAAYRINAGGSTYTAIATSLADSPFFADMYFNGYAVTVFCNGYNRIIYTGLAQDNTTDTKQFYTGVVHCGRFFARDYSDGFKLWWSASHALDWESGIYGSGYTYLPIEGGDILRLFSYDDRLIAVRERGITVMRAYGDPQNYKVDATANYLTVDGVVGRTCAESGGKIIFCTQSGIYAFDGSDIDRLKDFADEGLSAPQFAAAFGDMYCLVCTEDDVGSGVMYCLDLSSGEGWKTTLAPCALFAGPDALYAVTGTIIIKLVSGSGSLQLYTQPVTFGARRAFLREVNVVCDGDVTIRVSALGVSRTFIGSGVHRVDMYGTSFTFTVTAQGKLRVLTARAEV